MPNQKAVEDKKRVVRELKESLARSRSAIVTDYRGLDVARMTRLRRSLREAGVEYRVAKNTLIGIAAREAGLEGFHRYLKGPTAIAFGYEDPVTPARLVVGFARENKLPEIKGGLLEGRLIDAEQVKWLADLPGREVLLSRVAGGMRSPLAGLVTVLQSTLRGFVYAVESLRKQREAQA
ncbi:MAG: 50S ribosomal protein L10 [Firmicutes bacterium]|nr:50S ribosomal protein L10 [Bacillota bacterium]